MRKRKLLKKWRAAFGAVPEVPYFDGDMNYIRAYYDFRAEHHLDPFLLDEITWNDLELDRVYRRINPSRCTSGEQYLYYMLRSPAVDRESYERRKKLVEFAQADPARRLRVELILARLGCTRRADLCRAFYPETHGVGMLLLYLALCLFFVAAAVCAAAHLRFGLYALLPSLLLNLYMHEFGRRRSQRDYDTVNYVVRMVFAVRKLRRLRDPALDGQLAPAYESLERLRAVIRTGGVSTGMDGDNLADALLSVTLLDLITYEFLKNKLGRCHDDVFAIHEHLGRLDAAISIASYRASVPGYAEPTLRFERSGACGIRAEGLIHPLLNGAVPNDLVTQGPLLITGSNASGKSTYLKTAALAVVLAQSICTVPAASYAADAFRIYSSMALRDDLLAGESYYIAETKSLKRILHAAKEESPVFCVVDEVLRGTNTVERIAASSEVLRALAEVGTICLAATHDMELCDILRGVYRLYHFEEQIGEDEMLFDYVLREGPTTSRNAIELLRLMGFDRAIVDSAHARANRYLERGAW